MWKTAHDHTSARSQQIFPQLARPWRKTPGRLFGTALVRLYQLTLSGFVGNSCRHLPTCSEYAYEAIARHGLWAGGWMGLFRVCRCGPGGTHGIDRVPEQLCADALLVYALALLGPSDTRRDMRRLSRTTALRLADFSN